MKRLLVFSGVVFFCLFISAVSFAETIGNVADINYPPGKGVYSSQMADFVTLNVGFDTEMLIEKKFKCDSAITTQAPDLSGQYYMGRISVTLFNKIQPYVKLGYSDLEMEWKDNANGTVKLDMNYAPAWAVGVKAYLWEFEGMGLKVFSAASFRSTKPDKVDSLSVNGVTGGVTNKKFQIYEKQAAIGISREFKPGDYKDFSIVPYVGVAWSATNARVSVTQNANVINSGAKEQEDNWGLFFGADVMIMDSLSFNVEGRFIDQKAASVGLSALF
ncbi:MAG: hypothetical protein COW11_06630 [Candidatus Omnitrophica bacterium CG12_big_fil_rev_8_21_14_0_65_43_15]|uniref:Outer membrane protein beta-barrel domain-containing protein n=1 Tax=Candidatus Taenaricola geysiri TaxID=1974752 RepID=A0A2J0LM85_9BACT|nr:MAG: hypothetical protein AUJ89_03475 [Candidatus Omnitrophica bacterium CG1_02_43_210]PIV11938.1 MAG: hypothetical protein COS48_03320 [Candidatus Omnitrophica bacterium CG03_land_8_20_14_0_80_43_22]PIW65796.1 MAG: hypothetical protein COW11_06630 [Candidatus Omnitrophica bacterium CG12_big_fil_rev_8_21_14_0_65_43_15]PIW80019.1 MAG: hypothetical protein COZ98_04470 [Candidatus Omnitrophica bacterium CG_4_8_14_3_um_filter_43_15]PIY83248.1 MAG: hypothetical protein COY77_05795 [Candidatus Omn